MKSSKKSSLKEKKSSSDDSSAAASVANSVAPEAPLSRSASAVAAQDPNKSEKPTVGSQALPTELVSNRILTHFDETAGVAIPRWEVEQHTRTGSVVVPLAEAYKSRYTRLRTGLTSQLLPKREHLLQLRRRLQSAAAETECARRGIERETLADADRILERVRAAESLRQASIQQQVLQVEAELATIERLVRRVEQANSSTEDDSSVTTGVLLTSAQPGSIPVEAFRAPRAVGMVELIHEFGDLQALTARLAALPVTVQANFPTDDFPRETKERLDVLARC
ncbi:hypothetical protein B484DRAFT_457198, partial [Ochromonadaceae sp. CCMP2298]